MAFFSGGIADIGTLFRRLSQERDARRGTK
jgi:hypothetical protein